MCSDVDAGWIPTKLQASSLWPVVWSWGERSSLGGGHSRGAGTLRDKNKRKRRGLEEGERADTS